MIIRLEIEKGDNVLDCSDVAAHIARTLDITVKFTLNGTETWADPVDDKRTAYVRWRDERSDEDSHLEWQQ